MAEDAIDDYINNRNEARPDDFHKFNVANHTNVRYRKQSLCDCLYLLLFIVSFLLILLDLQDSHLDVLLKI